MKRSKINVLSQLQSWLLHGKMQLGHSDNSNYPFKINFLICTVREQLRYSVSCCEVSYLASCSCSRNVTRSYTGLILYLVYIYYIPYTHTIYHIPYTIYYILYIGLILYQPDIKHTRCPKCSWVPILSSWITAYLSAMWQYHCMFLDLHFYLILKSLVNIKPIVSMELKIPNF